MNRILSLTAAFAVILMLPFKAEGREKKQRKWDAQPYKYEVRIGWGMPNSTNCYYTVYDSPDYFSAGEGMLDEMYRLQSGPVYSTGGFFAEFNMNFRKWFALSVTASVNSYWSDVYSPLADSTVDTVNGLVVGVMPVARFYAINRPVFRMYGSVGLGMMMNNSDVFSAVYPAFQFSPIGVAVGKDFFGFCEVVTGAETNALGLYFGIGCRF